MNTSLQRQTLKANNVALARGLQRAKGELRRCQQETIDLKEQNQRLVARNNHLESLLRSVENFDAEVEKSAKVGSLATQMASISCSRSHPRCLFVYFGGRLLD